MTDGTERVACVGSSPTDAPNGSPIALVTNDDGLGAQGLMRLRDALRASGMRVVVVGPSTNHSGGGHGVSMRAALRLSRRGDDVWECSGTPADCVRVGVLSGLVPAPAVVVAGINHGANAGDDVRYSGTVAAAAEAALLGVPALAASQHGPDSGVPFLPSEPYSFPYAEYVARLARWLSTAALPSGLLLNVNLPQRATTSIVALAEVGARRWRTAAVAIADGGPDDYVLTPWSRQPSTDYGAQNGDFALLAAGTATVTVLSAAAGGLRDVLETHRHHMTTMPADLASRTGPS